jgi:hypothetical protein
MRRALDLSLGRKNLPSYVKNNMWDYLSCIEIPQTLEEVKKSVIAQITTLYKTHPNIDKYIKKPVPGTNKIASDIASLTKLVQSIDLYPKKLYDDLQAYLRSFFKIQGQYYLR